MIYSRLFQSSENGMATPQLVHSQQPQCSSSIDTSRLPGESLRLSYSVPLTRGVVCRRNRRTNTVTKISRVRFEENVSIIEIPSHRSYSRDTKQRMWNGTRQIRADANRNKIEWAADGRDWKNCKEEDEMLTLAGELIHPVTYLSLQRCSQRRLFLRLRQENRKDASSLESPPPMRRVSSCRRVTASEDSVSRPESVAPRDTNRSLKENNVDPSTVTITSAALQVPQDKNHFDTTQLKLEFVRKTNPKMPPIKVQRSRKCFARKRATLFSPGNRSMLLS